MLVKQYLYIGGGNSNICFMFNPSFFGEDEPIYDGRIFFKGGGLNHQADINTPGELLNQPLLVDGSAQFDKQIPSMFSVYLTTRG